MISVTFRMREDSLTGFTVSGHAGVGSAGRDIVCAAVSSAVYMAANTVTDVLHCPADITVGDGLLSLDIPGDAAAAQAILSGLRLHLQALHDQYPRRVQLSNTEV